MCACFPAGGGGHSVSYGCVIVLGGESSRGGKALPLPDKVAKDDWLCIPCEVECMVEVVLERSCLKNVSRFRDCHVYVIYHHSLY